VDKPSARMYDLRHTMRAVIVDEGEELLMAPQTLGYARQSNAGDLYVGKVPKVIGKAADRFGELLDADRKAAN
jgi:hypothetical protein